MEVEDIIMELPLRAFPAMNFYESKQSLTYDKCQILASFLEIIALHYELLATDSVNLNLDNTIQ